MSIDIYYFMEVLLVYKISVLYLGDSEYRGGMGFRGRGEKFNFIIFYLEDKGVRS